jgi:hypothetical protein
MLGWGWGAKTALFYAGTNLLCMIWCWFRLPETKDRTFGEIDLLFEHKVPARKFKSTSVDRKCYSVARLLDAFADTYRQNSLCRESIPSSSPRRLPLCMLRSCRFD